MKNMHLEFNLIYGVQIEKLIVFVFLLALSFFIGNQQLISQNSDNIIDHQANNPIVGDLFDQQAKALINNAGFVSSSIAITILEGNLIDIGQLIENGNLPPKQEIELTISFEFRKHILADLINGSSVKDAFENNLNYFIATFIEMDAKNHGINPKELFKESVDLVSH